MRSRSLPETPCDFNLKMRPSCQTSSNALEISKNIARVSLDGYSLNALCISLVIGRSRLIVESPGRKPDCLGVKRLFLFRNSYITSKINFSNIFLHMGNNEIGVQFFLSCQLSFLWIGSILALFHA